MKATIINGVKKCAAAVWFNKSRALTVLMETGILVPTYMGSHALKIIISDAVAEKFHADRGLADKAGLIIGGSVFLDASCRGIEFIESLMEDWNEAEKKAYAEYLAKLDEEQVVPEEDFFQDDPLEG